MTDGKGKIIEQKTRSRRFFQILELGNKFFLFNIEYMLKEIKGEMSEIDENLESFEKSESTESQNCIKIKKQFVKLRTYG